MKLRRRHGYLSLTGVYALDALEPGSEQRFARHLRRCAACTAEVRGLREVATSLAFAAAEQPPPAMRPRVLSAVSETRQLPPETRRAFQPRLSGLWVPRLTAVVAVAAVAAIAVLGLAQLSTARKLSRARQENQAIAAVLAAPDARILKGRTSVGGLTTVVVSPALRELIVTTDGLPALHGSQVYELWLIGPPRTRPAGLLPAAIAGRIGPVLATGLVSGDEVGMTVEPAGGTSRPTTAPIVLLRLPS